MRGREKLQVFPICFKPWVTILVNVVDGSHSLVVGIRTITISPLFSLQEILHVPKLSYNYLTSIIKIIRDPR